MHVFITGASSGIGAALAEAYAKKGVLLSLCGRDKKRLETVATKTRAAGADVQIFIADVAQRPLIDNCLSMVLRRAPLDLAIIGAGISAGTGKSGENYDQMKEIFDINLMGAMNTLFPVLDFMSTQGQGQIGLVSSLAGFRGLPGVPAYGASKAALRIYGEALRGDMAKKGIKINVICPGFVKTPMTDVNDFPMPFLMSAQKAAKIIKKGLQKNKGRISFPWPMTILVWFLSTLPSSFIDWLVLRLPKKP